MLMNLLAFLGGLVALLIGGRLLVAASVDTATRLRVSPLVVGLTLVAWGTSAPELALNIVSALRGRSDMATGNIVGANICNMALVLGAAALLRPLVVQERLIRVEIWLNAGILVFMAVLGLAAGFQRWEGAVMLFVFGLYSMWTIMAALRASAGTVDPTTNVTDPAGNPAPMSWLLIVACFVGGLILLSIGGSFASDGASGIALALSVPPAVVGVTVVSIGTTLPELVTCVLAVRKGQSDLAMGNAVGSCLFNAGAIFGLTALIAPPAAGPTLTAPLLYMALLALVLIPFSRTDHRTVSRLEGIVLLGSYAAFLAYAGWQARAMG
ncbi:MAG: sodium:calcium antiporter [Phycisphaerae bacterium]|nr:MAG: sodium:calcium antiporter [Phycisphaerae bacterium]